MTGQLDDLHRVKRGVAMLTACMVQTLKESDPTFEERFLARLARAYDAARELPVEGDLHEIEILSWTREYITGFSVVHGQGKPFLED